MSWTSIGIVVLAVFVGWVVFSSLSRSAAPPRDLVPSGPVEVRTPRETRVEPPPVVEPLPQQSTLGSPPPVLIGPDGKPFND